MLVKINAGHNVNGNPRRAWVQFGEYVELINAWDEGYSGYAAVPAELQDEARKAPQLIVTPAYYREVLKDCKGKK